MVDAKIEFEKWLKAGNSKKFAPSFVIANIEDASKWAVEKSITKVSFFEMTDYRLFDQIRNKLLGNKIFRIAHKATYKMFDKVGNFYSQFLKELASGKLVYTSDKPSSMDQKVAPIKVYEELAAQSKDSAAPTIIEAVRTVLKDNSPLTIKEIYNTIITRGLYNFKSATPISALTSEMRGHCVGIELSSRQGCKKEFALISNRDNDEAKYGLYFANDKIETVENSAPQATAKQLVIESDGEAVDWQGLIFAFQEFIKTQVAKSTARSYYSTAKNILQNYPDEWERAQSQALSKERIAQAFFNLLLENPKYVKNNEAYHNQLNAALRWFIRFLGGNPEPILTKKKVFVEDSEQREIGNTIDWNNLPNLSKIKPGKIEHRLDGELKSIFTKNWTELLCAFFELMADKYTNIDLTLVKSERSKKKLCSYNPDEVVDHFKSRKKLKNGLFVDSNFSANDIIHICYNLMLMTNTAFELVTIHLRGDDNVQNEADEAEIDSVQVVEEVLNEQEERVLVLFKNSFERGIRLQFRDFMMLRHTYEREFGEELTLNDDEISKSIKRNGFETEPNKFSHIDNLLCGTNVAEIELLIAEQNKIGAKRIWIEPLYNHFRERLGLAVSADLLMQIILKVGKKKYRKDDSYGYIFYSGISLDGQKEEMLQAVANLLKREGTHLTLDEIQQGLPAYPSLASKKGLNLANSPYIVELTDGSFSHIDCVYIADDEVSKVEEIIDGEMDETGQAIYESVNAVLRERLPSIFENNESCGISGVWKALASRIEDKYSFNSWQIQRKRG